MYLSGEEIKDLAEYAGFKIAELSETDADILEHEFQIHEPKKLVTCHHIEDDDGKVNSYRHVVTCDGCDGNECTPLGKPLDSYIPHYWGITTNIKIMATDKRTLKQNKSLHKYCELLADALNDAGLDMKKVLRPTIDIPWTKTSVKEHLWKPIQEAMLSKESTTEMQTNEPSQHVDWPCKENEFMESIGAKREGKS